MKRMVVVALLIGTMVPADVSAARRAAPDPKLVEEMAEDAARYAEAVAGFRRAAGQVMKHAYRRRMNSIRSKYEPEIVANEKEEKARRLDAIAMFEAFLRKYPNDRRWTPDAMFRLAELYYEKSSEEFLDAQEAFQLALDGPEPPPDVSPIPDYNATVNLYRRLLSEFPNYRFLDATLYLLGFSLGEMELTKNCKQKY